MVKSSAGVVSGGTVQMIASLVPVKATKTTPTPPASLLAAAATTSSKVENLLKAGIMTTIGIVPSSQEFYK